MAAKKMRLPRAGTVAAKLLAVTSRKGGATRWHDQEAQQRSRMRESCMSGSVRGASSDRRLYSTLPFV